VTDAFDVTFDFRISAHKADGMGFMIEKNGNTAVGHDGGGFAMSGLNGFGVELDTWKNDNACSEADNNHTAVDSLTQCPSNTDVPTPIAVSAELKGLYGYDLGDNTWRTCVVHMAGGLMSVTINQSSSNMPAVSNAMLTGFTSGDSYYFGFGGGTGGFNQKQEIKNVNITFPAPRCL
jgi:hypothetical protein